MVKFFQLVVYQRVTCQSLNFWPPVGDFPKSNIYSDDIGDDLPMLKVITRAETVTDSSRTNEPKEDTTTPFFAQLKNLFLEQADDSVPLMSMINSDPKKSTTRT